jgi:membrane protein required for colicin V production
MSLAFTFVDLLTVAVVVVSMVLAVWRGFVSETLSIVAWAAAAFASLYFGSWVAQLLSHMISPWWLAFVSGYALVFLVVLIPISFASFRLSETIRSSAVGPLDRSLGAAFGIARGLAIVGGLYLLFSIFVPIHNQPKPLREARLLPLIQSSAEVLIALAPNRDRIAAEEHLQAPTEGPVPQAAPPRERESRPAPQRSAGQSAHKRTPRGYGAADRRALDRLIEATGGTGKP